MKLWAELRRRHVLRMAGLYIVGTWLVFQVADIFFPAWGVPDLAMRYLVYAAVLCLPVALVFSWFYDVTADGIVRTPAALGPESVEYSLKLTDYLILAALFVVAATIVLSNFDKVIRTAQAPVSVKGTPRVTAQSIVGKPANSLAVLPFDNLDTNPDTGYFSDGVSEEILYRLASVQSLKVLGKISSFAFAESNLSLEGISDILGVRYLLNGSIRRDGDQIRLTARLLDDAGYQLWSESFDGELKDIFQFQAEIAARVASEITRELVEIKPANAARATENAEAYRLYLVGKEYFNKRPASWHAGARIAFRQAIELDPGFAPPYAGLAIALQLDASAENRQIRLAEAETLITQALELDPLLAEAWMAKGLPNRANPKLRLNDVITDLERAIELNPTLVTAYNWLSIAYQWSGRDDEADEIRDRGFEIDPLNPPLVLNVADEYLAAGDFEGWKHQVLTLLELPDPPGMVFSRLSSVHALYGRLPEALDWEKKGVLHYRRVSNGGDLGLLAMIYEKLGMSSEADFWLDQWQEYSHDPTEVLYARMELQFARGNQEEFVKLLGQLESLALLDQDDPPEFMSGFLGLAYIVTGYQYETGIQLLERDLNVEEPIDPGQAVEPDLIRATQVLAFAYEHTGQKDKAISMIGRAIELTRILHSTEWFQTDPGVLLVSALNHAALGELQQGAAALQDAVDGGWRDYYATRHDPTWRGALKSREFESVVAQIEADLERQRRAVEAVEAAHSFHGEFELSAQKQ